MGSNIIIAKGSLSVTIQTEEVDDNYTNKIEYIRPGTTTQNQSVGPKETKVIDLLIITHEIQVRGRIVETSAKTAKDIARDLITIFNGANTSGGACTVTYDLYASTLNMYIEKLLITEEATDEPTSLPDGAVKYNVQVTLVEGEKV